MITHIEPFVPTQREWIELGPFQMDKSEYALGEKIFVNIKNLNKNDKGTMIFTKIINSTHISEYKQNTALMVQNHSRTFIFQYTFLK